MDGSAVLLRKMLLPIILKSVLQNSSAQWHYNLLTFLFKNEFIPRKKTRSFSHPVLRIHKINSKNS